MKIKMEMEIELIDVKHTEDELTEYLMFLFRDRNTISSNNPFHKYSDQEPIHVTFEWDYI